MKTFWQIFLPAIFIFLIAAACLRSARSQALFDRPAPATTDALAHNIKSVRENERNEYVLEVIGLGAILDGYRQGSIWDAVIHGNPLSTIRNQNPDKYPWARQDKKAQEGGRTYATMENAAALTPFYWGVPSFMASSPAMKQDVSEKDPIASIASLSSPQLLIPAGWELSERPDVLLARVFDFFDENPDVPYVILSAGDGLYDRDKYRHKGTPQLITDGYYVPSIPDSTAAFVLARRDHAEPMRRYAFDDYKKSEEIKTDITELNSRNFARRVYLSYLKLQETLPHPPNRHSRLPTSEEWIRHAAEFAKRPDIVSRTHSIFDTSNEHPPADFKPTPWFPIPWNNMQWKDFDGLPTYGYLHRPVYVKTVDEHGRPLARRDARAAALAAGWQEALKTLPEGERKAAPAHVLTSTGGNLEQAVAITSVLDAWAAQGGPELDRSKAGQWIDTDARLGNTGAATWFMQIAIGLMGSYREGGASAAINLRDPSEASIVFVTPPSDAQRKSQTRSDGTDVLGNIATPTVNLDNYK